MDPKEELIENQGTTAMETAEASPMPEETEKPRHPLFDRIKGKYPDKEFTSDDDYLSSADEMLTEHESYKQRNEEANQMIIEALFAEPVLAQVLEDVGKGATLIQALAKHISPEDLDEAAAATDDETFQNNLKARNENRAAHKAFMDEVNANSAASQKVIEEWSAKRGLDPDNVTEFINDVNAALADIFKGKITPKFLDDMYEARTKADDIAEAEQIAEVRGRNAGIEEKEANAGSLKGDNLPDITSMGANPVIKEKPKSKYADLDEVVNYASKSR